MGVAESVIAELVAREQIRDSLARYAHGNDRGDAALLASVFHPDAIFDMGVAKATGGDLSAGKPSTSKRSDFHQLGQSLIHINGDRATSETYFLDLMRSSDGERDYDVLVAGRYVDVWTREGDEPFRIAERTIVFDNVRTDPVVALYPGPDTNVMKLEWGGTVYSGEGVTWGVNTQDDLAYQTLRAIRESAGESR